MATTFVRGDLFDYGLRAFAHGCNCAGAMGKGIALEFRARFPDMYLEYKALCGRGDFNLGDVFVWSDRVTTVFNLGTQRSWRTKAEMTAVESSLKSMIRLAEGRAIDRIGLPRIASGLGGLDWEPIRSLLKKLGDSTSCELVVFEDFIRAQGSVPGSMLKE